MKQKDVTLIIIVAFIGAIFSFALSNLLIDSPKNRNTAVEVVQKITSDFPTPDKKYFNEQALNPTKIIQIGDNTNNQPFNNKQR